MSVIPLEIKFDILPRSRFDVIDISKKTIEQINGSNSNYRKAAYCSFHTTAGYLEQSICSRLQYNREKIESYIHAFQKLFPTDADYRHDKMELRTELTEAQRKQEPKNADSHLTFIGSGLKNCVTYINKKDKPVYFIDLDGVNEYGSRNRQTSVMFYNQEEVVYQNKVHVPVSRHPVDSINLRDAKLGYLDKLAYLLKKYDVEKGRIDITLDPAERHAGLTVNEFETLLMSHDLIEVLRNPLKFMSEKGKYILQHPKIIPYRTKEYAKYDLVHIFNELMDTFHISQSVLEKILAKFIAFPAERFLRLKRGISLLVSNERGGHAVEIVRGTYQSPILVQWKPAQNQTRNLCLTITRFK
jgi:thiamine phosphate synthase YjbQ (UPF0047 family)